MEEESVKNKKDIKYKIILCIIIAVSLASIIYCFATKKEGWHSDEVWSYGYANSYYKMQLYQDKDGNLTNLNEWVDSKILNDYIEVNDGEKFAFDSVYDNQIQDLSPPLHSMILHAICSFFPNTFSWWYSFAINIVSFIVCMIFLYKTAVVLKNEEMGLICCVLYGVSLAARDTYVYLRMYAMCTAMTMILLYNVCVYIKNSDNDKIITKNIIGIFIVSLLMFFTHYYMIPLVGIITAGICILFLLKRNVKKMLVYGGMQLLSLILSITIFPSVIRIFISHQNTVATTVSATMDYKLPAKMKVMANFILYKLYGIRISVFADFIWLKAGFLILLSICIILLPLFFYCRNTSFVCKIKYNTSKIIRNICKLIQDCNKIYFILLVIIIGQTLVVALTSQVYNMGWDEGRYIMYLYPMVTIVFVGAVYSLAKSVKKKSVGNIIMILLAICVIIINLYYRSIDNEYYYKNNIQGKDLAEVVAGKDCIYLTNSKWAIVYMTPILKNSNEYFQVSKEGYMEYSEDFLKKAKDDVVILVDISDLESKRRLKNYTENSEELIDETEEKYNSIIEYYKKIYSAQDIQRQSTQYVFGRVIEAYTLK